jgi:hypothetical protein
MKIFAVFGDLVLIVLLFCLATGLYTPPDFLIYMAVFLVSLMSITAFFGCIALLLPLDKYPQAKVTTRNYLIVFSIGLLTAGSGFIWLAVFYTFFMLAFLLLLGAKQNAN